MCGIAGEVSYSHRPDVADVQGITNSLAHRGPDDGGIWTSGCGHCVLGHRRLSIIDLSALGHQPMVDRETGNAIAFNGEIYNFLELRRECERLGDHFQSNSDTEVILALYRRYGQSCVDRLRGMFAFAIWDVRSRRLFLARDRSGKKPLHYSVVGNRIAFASEISPLSRHPIVERGLDAEALSLYLQLQSIPAPWTIYRGVRKLPPGHTATFDDTGLSVRSYHSLEYEPKLHISDSDALDEFEQRLIESVRLRMISDVPVGALLSGGVDSSVVVAIMSKLSSSPIRTFSIGFTEGEFNELPFAQFASDRFGTIHTPEVVEGDVAKTLPLLARHYGEPFADSSAVPSFEVSRIAQQHVSVVLNGDGGDELLGGYDRYNLGSGVLNASRFTRNMLDGNALARLGEDLVGSSLYSRALRRTAGRYAWPELTFSTMYSSFWDDRSRAELLSNVDVDGRLLRNWRSRWFDEAIAHANGPVDRMLWIDNKTYLPDDLLVKMDIASMHVGLEARSPFLDQDLVSYCARLAETQKTRGGVGKFLLKRLAERYFPADFVHRKKMGFGIPLEAWLRGPLRSTVRAYLNDASLMAPLNMNRVRQELLKFEEGSGEGKSRIWSLLMFAQWRATECGA